MFPWGPGDLRWESVLIIPMRVIKGDWNGAVSRNNRKKAVPLSVLWRTRKPYEMSMATGEGARPEVELLQSACTSMCRHMYNLNIIDGDVKQPVLTHSRWFCPPPLIWSSPLLDLRSIKGCCCSIRLGYCFTPYQRQWLYNGAPLVAFYDTLGIRRMYSRLKPPASSRGTVSRYQMICLVL